MSDDKPICAECKHLGRQSAGNLPYTSASLWKCTPEKDKIDYITGRCRKQYCESLNLLGECTLFELRRLLPLPDEDADDKSS